MLRSAFGVIALVLLGSTAFIQLGLRAEVVGSDVGRSVEASESDVTDTVVSSGTALLDAPELVGSNRPGARQRRFGGEPSTLLLLGVALFGAAHYARRPTRTHP
jgi:hypothetical protein